MTDWQPVNPDHSIEVMAAVVSFSQPLPDLLFRKMLSSSEEAAFGAGLKSRHSTRGFGVIIGPSGVQQDLSLPQGRVFNSLFQDAGGALIPGKIAEQVQVTQQQVVYRTWQYQSWTAQSERIRSLLSPGLNLAFSIASINSIRLEYLDRFFFLGPPSTANFPSLFNRESQLLAPFVFDAKDLWHLHTGTFLPSNSPLKLLQQVSIDVLDDDQSASDIRRYVNIMSARENRFPADAVDLQPGNYDHISKMYGRMQSELKELFRGLVTPAIAQLVHLTDS